ncbi:MAG: phosphocholine cytidylyltransferase family protein [Candidatus Omnitrophica bacterium]|nr:phosphocholine cytidylyltransferase family protein [Candidatus Omnitrophota bacterium]
MKNKNENYKAVILAAGIGSRIREVMDIPKSMIKIDGKYIFEMMVDVLIAAGIRDIIFIVGYKRKQLKSLILSICSKKVAKITFIENKLYRETNTLFSLWLARRLLNCKFVYLHGDLIFSPKMLEDFLLFQHGNCAIVDKNFPKDWDDAMKVICHRGEIEYMSKSITMSESDGTAIGIYKFNAIGANRLFGIIDKLVKKGVKKNWVSEAINILGKRVRIKAKYNYAHSWVDVDNLVDLKMANKILQRIERE